MNASNFQSNTSNRAPVEKFLEEEFIAFVSARKEETKAIPLEKPRSGMNSSLNQGYTPNPSESRKSKGFTPKHGRNKSSSFFNENQILENSQLEGQKLAQSTIVTAPPGG
mmetsp:Transcript_29522/g.44899  ORF Transcript_29522/g.44899 Transcript_29522/m.44899 type:complete len:110 (-) Transcript_29522:2201-2530(-)